LICKLTGSERAAFCNTGSEAVMAALRVARTVTGRSAVVYFAGSYHGNFDEVLMRSSNGRSMPIAPGIPREVGANITILEYGSRQAIEYIQSHANELAAVLVEPVQSRHPDLQPVDFLREVRTITSRSGTALIFDEVVTGFRIHPGGAQALFGIRADLSTYGKVAGGGMPIGILAGRATFMDSLDGGMWNFGDESAPEAGMTFFAGTFVRHPLALAATKAILSKVLEAGPSLQESLNRKADALVARLAQLLRENEVPARIANFGSIIYFSFAPEFRMGSLLYGLLREKGIHLQEGFPCFLTTAHSEADLAAVVKAFQESIFELQSVEILPRPLLAPLSSEGLASARIPLTESQREIWLAVQMGDEASCAFNESVTLSLGGALNLPAIRRAFQDVVMRRDALRLRFDPAGDFMTVTPAADLELPLLDCSEEPQQQQPASLRELIATEATSPFDLVNGPLFRAVLLKYSDREHKLVFTAHHIAIDGWSMNVVFEDLGRIYSVACGVGKSDVSPVLSFQRYALKQFEKLQGGEYKQTEEWWSKQYAVLPPPLAIPTDRPRAAVRTGRGATAREVIETDVYVDVRKAGAAQGCTLYATVLSAFAVLLHRLADQSDLVIGIPAAGQSSETGGSLAGHCVNFLPVRINVEDSVSLADFMRDCKRRLLDAYEHQGYTYGSLIRKLHLPRSADRLPLIEAQFNVEKVGTNVRMLDLEANLDSNPKRFVNTDLFLNIADTGKQLILDCDYNTDLFDEATVRHWLGCFRNILVAVVDDATRPIDALPLLNGAMEQKILEHWTGESLAFERDSAVHTHFERQAATTPAAVAAIFQRQELTYRELNGRANQLARRLQAYGVKRDTLVGIHMERGVEMLLCLLAVMKAGGAYVPLDPSYPSQRLNAILEDTQAPLILTQLRLAPGLNVRLSRIVCVDSEQELTNRESTSNLDRLAAGDDLAYVIFTSGSTGRPKGVQVTHRSFVNLLAAMRRRPGLSPSDRLVAVTTLSFDIAGLELFLPLVTGACTIVASREEAGDGQLLLLLLEESKATMMQATPSTWRMLLEAGWDGQPRLRMLCGGESLSRSLADDLLKCGDDLWNMYGPTETTIWSSTARVMSGERTVSLGQPIANTRFAVLDRKNNLVPAGVPGELHIGGDGVARGYLQQPELTRRKFVDDRFSAEPGARLYRTGDIVRYKADGVLEFLGRMDNQVKVRGFRIELGEIEAALLLHEGVKEAVALAFPSDSGEQRLIAWVTPHDLNNPVKPAELRLLLEAQLPGYMTPSLIVPLALLPRAPNGKIDQKALGGMLTACTSAAEISKPVTSEEKTLAGIWSQVLGIDEIGVDQSIFELGADSLLIFRIAMLSKQAGFRFTVRDVYQHRTIAALARVGDNCFPDPAAHVPQISRVGRDSRRVSRMLA
jgi:amino acid adenylation domain-containing protein